MWEQQKGSFVEILNDFNREYDDALPESSSLTTIIDFYQAKQTALNEYTEELKREILNIQGAICTAIVRAVDEIADSIEQEQRTIKAQIQEDFAFTLEEQELFEKMNNCAVQRVAESARDGKSPEILEPILENATEKKNELQKYCLL
ncbi:hypothetical protein [Legionella tunisiensis]|uniref:hypothetical protein n=1 Tax=Legionella tunisiensis TaxID=1034944 RepID=UPI0002F69A24|nr:hypothetical protein [Legionella tunisiensis]